LEHCLQPGGESDEDAEVDEDEPSRPDLGAAPFEFGQLPFDDGERLPGAQLRRARRGVNEFMQN
jgi:hypothetical protein